MDSNPQDTSQILDTNSFQYFFDNTTSIYIVLNQDLNIVKVNATFKNLLGEAGDELLGKNFTELIYSDDKGRVEEIKVRENLTDELLNVRVMAKNDEFKWLELRVKRQELLYLVCANDISSQKQIQDELMKQNRQLEAEMVKEDALVKSIGDGIIVVNDHGEITFVNEQALNLLGYKTEELLNKVIMHVIRMIDEKGDDITAQERPINKALKNKLKETGSKFSYIKKDGTLLPIAYTATPIVLNDMVVGGVIVFKDVTKEKEVDRMKTEFISLASHQLRTPLSAMKWFAELVLDGKDPLTAEQKQLVENIYNSNERMIDLVNSLLNISRIESGRIIIDPKPTDLAELINQVVLELQPKLNEKKHHLAISLHNSLPKINIDPKLIRNVYMNILTNAIKYTHEGGEIHIFVSKSNDEVISQITDNGYGIPESQQQRVFEKFFRGENVLKVQTDGSGLGLYLIKLIVESSGGKIWFKSKEGIGTTFWFSLPIAGVKAKKGEVTIDT